MLSLTIFSNDFASSTLDVLGNVMGGFSPFLTLVVGALLAVAVVAIVIRIFIHR